MTISRLRALAPPPIARAQGQPPWQAVEGALQLQLPDDYKEIVHLYGSGRFANFLTIFTPFARNGYLNLLTEPDLALDAYRTLASKHPDATPYPAYPEPGGLFPWAQTDNGDVVYWLTEGPSTAWPIVVFEARHAFNQRYDLRTTEFLARLLEGRLSTDIFPSLAEQHDSAPFASLPETR